MYVSFFDFVCDLYEQFFVFGSVFVMNQDFDRELIVFELFKMFC